MRFKVPSSPNQSGILCPASRPGWEGLIHSLHSAGAALGRGSQLLLRSGGEETWSRGWRRDREWGILSFLALAELFCFPSVCPRNSPSTGAGLVAECEMENTDTGPTRVHGEGQGSCSSPLPPTGTTSFVPSLLP